MLMGDSWLHMSEFVSRQSYTHKKISSFLSEQSDEKINTVQDENFPSSQKLNWEMPQATKWVDNMIFK